MTLKEELEILRGEPIEVFDGDPMEIPCIETSDAEKLCKHPVVSVCMVTYNHEPYIRQAIEGVMMQKTDFEFELVIGEDCSQDKTREICFEYQKKYPDKIRVLWWHENVSKGGLGGNGQRVRARCRGEFIAFCEGDDYWIDPLKLQKQVDVMRNNATIGLCFTNAEVLEQASGRISDWSGAKSYVPGIITGCRFFSMYCYGSDPKHGKIDPAGLFIMTASCIMRRSLFSELKKRYELFSWRLRLGDKQLWLGLATLGDVYYVGDKTAVYRKNMGGAMANFSRYIYRDSALIKIFLTIEGPYKYKIPASVLEMALRGRDYAQKCSSRELVQVLFDLINKCNVVFKGISLGSRLRWLLFYVVRSEWPFRLKFRFV